MIQPSDMYLLVSDLSFCIKPTNELYLLSFRGLLLFDGRTLRLTITNLAEKIFW